MKLLNLNRFFLRFSIVPSLKSNREGRRVTEENAGNKNKKRC